MFNFDSPNQNVFRIMKNSVTCVNFRLVLYMPVAPLNACFVCGYMFMDVSMIITFERRQGCNYERLNMYCIYVFLEL